MQTRYHPLPTFRPNEPTSSKQFGQMVHALKKPMQGASSPTPVEYQYPNKSTTAIGLYIILENQYDYLICSTWDGASIGKDSINIAKPFLLQNSLWDGSYGPVSPGTEIKPNIAYSSTGIDSLTVLDSDTGNTETWKVTQSYFVGALITAASNIEGGIDAYTGLPGSAGRPSPDGTPSFQIRGKLSSGIKFDWIDINIDGRGWAAV